MVAATVLGNPGQTCDDFLVIWRVVPTNCDGRSCTISHLHHQRICTSSLRSRSATSASCLLSTELTEIDPSSRVVSLIFVAMPPAVCVYVCIIYNCCSNHSHTCNSKMTSSALCTCAVNTRRSSPRFAATCNDSLHTVSGFVTYYNITVSSMWSSS